MSSRRTVLLRRDITTNLLNVDKQDYMKLASKILKLDPHERRDDEIHALMTITENLQFFQSINQKKSNLRNNLHQKICQQMKYESIKKGQAVIEFGGIADKFFVLLKGSVLVFLKKTEEMLQDDREEEENEELFEDVYSEQQKNLQKNIQFSRMSNLNQRPSKLQYQNSTNLMNSHEVQSPINPTSPSQINHTPSLSRAHTPSSSKAHTPSSSRAHTPSSPRAHTPYSPRAHTPQTPRAHTSSSPRAHTPQSPRAHTPQSPGNHTPSSQKTHTLSSPRTDTPSSPRMHTPSFSITDTHSSPRIRVSSFSIADTSSSARTRTSSSPITHTLSSARTRTSSSPITHLPPSQTTPDPSSPRTPSSLSPRTRAPSQSISFPPPLSITHTSSLPITHALPSPRTHTPSSPRIRAPSLPITHTFSSAQITHASSSRRTPAPSLPITHTSSLPISHVLPSPITHDLGSPSGGCILPSSKIRQDFVCQLESIDLEGNKANLRVMKIRQEFQIRQMMQSEMVKQIPKIHECAPQTSSTKGSSQTDSPQFWKSNTPSLFSQSRTIQRDNSFPCPESISRDEIMVLRRKFYKKYKYSQIFGPLSALDIEKPENLLLENSLIFKFYFHKSLEIGSTFGELGLLDGKPRSALIMCAEDCEFGVMEKEDYQKLLGSIHTKEITRRLNFFKQPMFQGLTNTDLKKISYDFQKIKKQRGDVVFHQGDLSDSVFLVKKGEVTFEQLIKISISEQSGQFSSIRKPSFLRKLLPFVTLGSGEYFGEEFLNYPVKMKHFRSYSAVISSLHASLYYMQRTPFVAFLKQRPSILSAFKQNITQKIERRKSYIETIQSTIQQQTLLQKQTLLYKKTLLQKEITPSSLPQESIDQTKLQDIISSHERIISESSQSIEYANPDNLRPPLQKRLSHEPSLSSILEYRSAQGILSQQMIGRSPEKALHSFSRTPLSLVFINDPPQNSHVVPSNKRSNAYKSLNERQLEHISGIKITQKEAGSVDKGQEKDKQLDSLGNSFAKANIPKPQKHSRIQLSFNNPDNPRCLTSERMSLQKKGRKSSIRIETSDEMNELKQFFEIDFLGTRYNAEKLEESDNLSEPFQERDGIHTHVDFLFDDNEQGVSVGRIKKQIQNRKSCDLNCRNDGQLRSRKKIFHAKRTDSIQTFLKHYESKQDGYDRILRNPDLGHSFSQSTKSLNCPLKSQTRSSKVLSSLPTCTSLAAGTPLQKELVCVPEDPKENLEQWNYPSLVTPKENLEQWNYPSLASPPGNGYLGIKKYRNSSHPVFSSGPDSKVTPEPSCLQNKPTIQTLAQHTPILLSNTQSQSSNEYTMKPALQNFCGEDRLKTPNISHNGIRIIQNHTQLGPHKVYVLKADQDVINSDMPTPLGISKLKFSSIPIHKDTIPIIKCASQTQITHHFILRQNLQTMNKDPIIRSRHKSSILISSYLDLKSPISSPSIANIQM